MLAVRLWVFAVRRNPSPALGVELNTLLLPGAQKADRYPAPFTETPPPTLPVWSCVHILLLLFLFIPLKHFHFARSFPFSYSSFSVVFYASRCEVFKECFMFVLYYIVSVVFIELQRFTFTSESRRWCQEMSELYRTWESKLKILFCIDKITFFVQKSHLQ